MAVANDTASMALFCDFENIALGVRDAQYEKFDIKPVLERLLAKGSIVVKKAYCDWERYKGFKAGMHEANFELIEIPHVRQSGKNSADIRMVVDALDLCYTKAHVDTFVIISGDSDFSPLVSKLRENAKRVIGVGVKQSCSDLLVTNCDEFIYYDDLVREREAQRASLRREREQGKRTPEEEQKRREKLEERKTRAVELAAATFADMIADRGENERIWASVLKEVIKRRNPGFNESYFGFRTFGNLLEEAAQRGLLSVGRDEKSGNYVTRAQPRAAESEPEAGEAPGELSGEHEAEMVPAATAAPVDVAAVEAGSGRRGGRGRGRGRKGEAQSAVAETSRRESAEPLPETELSAGPAQLVSSPDALAVASVGDERAGEAPAEAAGKARRAHKPARKEKSEQKAGQKAGPKAKGSQVASLAESSEEKPARSRRKTAEKRVATETAVVGEVAPVVAAEPEAAVKSVKPARQRSSRPRKAKEAKEAKDAKGAAEVGE
ncbi:NYN domain-containing protein [Dechloromonas sp. ZY10]|uniref:NYN domain-containing protein n=1 Tax=Dechloromonas aquae TaxID=2664436 RepID=UPI0035275373